MERTAKHFRKRDAILTCVRHTTVHPSADWVYARLKPEYPDLSLGTVYRNLSLFKEQGLIASLGTVGGVERFDGNTDPHVHFICARCGAVLDLEGMAVPQELQSQAASIAGGQVNSCRLSFSGTCGQCKKEETL
ncbi:MAG: transcriptional repressor [Oscillospiraceae bacterium]|nr:transcriptional repressor [Oscillospiraceae bacterium]